MKKAKKYFALSVIYMNRRSESFQTIFEDEEIEKYEIVNEDCRLAKTFFIFCYFSYLKKAMNKLKKINPDIIHCGNLDMLFFAVIYKRISKRKVKIVYEIGDLNKRTYNNSIRLDKVVVRKILIYLEKEMCKYVDRLVISTPYFWDQYYKNFVKRENVFLFPNMPEKAIFDRVKESNSKILTIGFIGRIRYYNQIKMLLETVDEINKRNNKLTYSVLIAGVGPESDKLLNDLKKFNFIDYYGAYNYDKEIAEIYSKVDIVYSVYDSSNLNVRVAIPNRLYEAIVSERPIIVAKDTKLAEFVIENKIGFAVNSDNNQDLRELLTGIYLGKVDLNEIKSHCKRIKDDYYIDSYQEKLIEMYKSIVK